MHALWLLLFAPQAEVPRTNPPPSGAITLTRFWETREPKDWTETELQQMFTSSPWASYSGTRIFLATARPIQEAEEQHRLRHKVRQLSERAVEPDSDYQDFLKDNPGKYIVVAFLPQAYNDLSEAEEMRRMEKESVLKIGKRKLRMTGHFPPTSSDPYLRMIFPRDTQPGDKKLQLELYLPGVSQPYRLIEFDLKEMSYRGKLEL